MPEASSSDSVFNCVIHPHVLLCSQEDFFTVQILSHSSPQPTLLPNLGIPYYSLTVLLYHLHLMNVMFSQ